MEGWVQFVIVMNQNEKKESMMLYLAFCTFIIQIFFKILYT